MPYKEREQQRQQQQYPSGMPRQIVEAFYNVGYSDNEIALLVSGHAGHRVGKRTIVGIRIGERGYSGRNLAHAFYALACVWGL